MMGDQDQHIKYLFEPQILTKDDGEKVDLLQQLVKKHVNLDEIAGS
jgi:hypothetical protein